jgi:hypothetical protein
VNADGGLELDYELDLDLEEFESLQESILWIGRKIFGQIFTLDYLVKFPPKKQRISDDCGILFWI